MPVNHRFPIQQAAQDLLARRERVQALRLLAFHRGNPCLGALPDTGLSVADALFEAAQQGVQSAAGHISDANARLHQLMTADEQLRALDQQAWRGSRDADVVDVPFRDITPAREG